jgi:hypothetical protein
MVKEVAETIKNMIKRKKNEKKIEFL